MLKNSLYLVLIILLSACAEEEEEFNVLDPDKIKAEHETKYNNEYIKIIDKDAQKDKPKRMINADAPLRSGKISVDINDQTKEFNTFKKGGTHMSLSEKGMRLHIKDMYDAHFSIYLGNNNILKDAVNNYTYSSEVKHLNGNIDYKDKNEGEEVHYQWVSGKAKLSEFSAGLGTVKLSLAGKAKELNTEEIVDFNLEMSLNIEEVTSSIRKPL